MKKLSRIIGIVLAVCILFGINVPEALASSKAKGTYWIGVDINKQMTTVYRTSDNSVVKRMICSTGRNSTPTPTGTFYLPAKKRSSERQEWYHFPEFGCYAKYATRIKGGILFHSVLFGSKSSTKPTSSSVKKLGSKASHGCIRLKVEDAKWIAENCPQGTMVKIYKGDLDVSKVNSTSKKVEAQEEDTKGSYSTLKSGDKNSDVKKLNQRLKDCGWLDSSVSRKYSSSTKDAVKAYQRAAGLSVTGEADEKTQKSLFGSSAKVGKKATLSKGMDNSPAVKELQRMLKKCGYLDGTPDGHFGSDTKSAVKAYQKAKGLKVTGKATPELQEMLAKEKSSK